MATDLAVTIIQAIVAGGTVAAAVISLNAMKLAKKQADIAINQIQESQNQTEIFRSQVITALAQIKADIILKCLNHYTDVQRTRSRAIRENNIEMARDHFREFIDLMWFEFQLWQKGLIDDGVIIAWTYARYKCYENNCIKIGDQEVSYRRVWEDLRSSGYYRQDDPFLTFYNLVHDGEYKDAVANYSIGQNIEDIFNAIKGASPTLQ
jgi:hypothetical protein